VSRREPAEFAEAFTTNSVEAFLNELDRAWPESWTVERTFSIAGLEVAVRYATVELDRFFSPALDHVRTSPSTDPDLTIEVADSRTAGVAEPAGFTPGGHSLATADRMGVFFQYERVLNLYDPAGGRARLWIEDYSALPPGERGTPFRHLLGWLLADHSMELVHAGAVGLDGNGVLLIGRGGSGKSTTALACLNDGFDFIAEDYTAVSLEGPTAHTLFSTAKLDRKHSERNPDLLPPNLGRITVDNKEMAFLADAYRDRLVGSISIAAIVKPTIGPGIASHPERIGGAAAVAYLAPSTIFQLPGRSEQVLATIASLVRAVPTYSLTLGSDLASIPRALRRLLESLE
jgi:hypothetical protein